MRLRLQPLFIICILVGMVIGPAAFAQSEYDAEGLRVKRIFSDSENAALSEPFKGVFTEDSVSTDLFPVHSTGVSTAPILNAAKDFLGPTDARAAHQDTICGGRLGVAKMVKCR